MFNALSSHIDHPPRHSTRDLEGRTLACVQHGVPAYTETCVPEKQERSISSLRKNCVRLVALHPGLFVSVPLSRESVDATAHGCPVRSTQTPRSGEQRILRSFDRGRSTDSNTNQSVYPIVALTQLYGTTAAISFRWFVSVERVA